MVDIIKLDDADQDAVAAEKAYAAAANDAVNNAPAKPEKAKKVHKPRAVAPHANAVASATDIELVASATDSETVASATLNEPVAPAANTDDMKGMTMNDTVTNIAEQAQAQAKEAVAKGQEFAKDAVAKTQEAAKDAAEFAKGNMEAMVEAGRVAMKGSEELGRDYADFMRKAFEDASANARKFAAVKTPTEFFQLQGEVSRTAMDNLVQQTSKNTEALFKLFNDVAQPIQNRVAVATAKVRDAA